MKNCPRKIEVAPEEQSMYDKVGKMNGLALWMVDDANTFYEKLKAKFGDKGVDRYWGIADGLDEAYIMKRITGRCSLAVMFEPIEKMEKMVDDNIVFLKEIEIFLKECKGEK